MRWPSRLARPAKMPRTPAGGDRRHALQPVLGAHKIRPAAAQFSWATLPRCGPVEFAPEVPAWLSTGRLCLLAIRCPLGHWRHLSGGGRRRHSRFPVRGCKRSLQPSLQGLRCLIAVSLFDADSATAIAATRAQLPGRPRSVSPRSPAETAQSAKNCTRWLMWVDLRCEEGGDTPLQPTLGRSVLRSANSYRTFPQVHVVDIPGSETDSLRPRSRGGARRLRHCVCGLLLDALHVWMLASTVVGKPTAPPSALLPAYGTFDGEEEDAPICGCRWLNWMWQTAREALAWRGSTACTRSLCLFPPPLLSLTAAPACTIIRR